MTVARPLPPISEARPPRGFVLLEGGADIDWSRWYLTDEEDMGQSPEQFHIIQRMLACLFELSIERGWTSEKLLIGADSYFGWVESEPLVRVSPDIYLLDDPPPRPHPDSFQTWRPGHRAPRFALEVVSINWKKDYDDAPERYSSLGSRELIVFDAKAGTKRSKRREKLQVFRRDALGALALVYAGPGPAYSEELDAWLVAVSHKGVVELALARDAEGKQLVPTGEEARKLSAAALAEAKVRAERAEKERDEAVRQREAALRQREAALRERDTEREAKEAALRELAELKRKLDERG